MFYSGTHVTQLGIIGLDDLLALAPFGMIFTIFATAGLVHALNLVDGFNCMAGAVGLTSIAALAWLRQIASADTMGRAVPALLGAIVSFLASTYPGDLIFLGDAGDYTIGLLIAWLAVLLVHEVSSLSPWAVLLVSCWPVADILLAIWQRAISHVPLGQQDRMHFHKVIMRTIEIAILRRKISHLSNPLTTLAAVPVILPPVLAGTLFWDSNIIAEFAFSVFSMLHLKVHLFLIRHAKRQRYGGALSNAVSTIALSLESKTASTKSEENQ